MPGLLGRRSATARHDGNMSDSRSARPARPRPSRRPQSAADGGTADAGRERRREARSAARSKTASGGTNPSSPSPSPAAPGPARQGGTPDGATASAGGRQTGSSGTQGRPRPRTTTSARTTTGARTTATRRPGPGRRGRAEDADTPRGKRTHPTLSFGGLTISVRLLGIAVLASVLAVMLVPSLFQWWRQEQDLRDITARVAAAEEHNADMRNQLDLWKDPDYIASQARSRLGYVLPGETQYTVVDPGTDQDGASQIAAAEPDGPARPWVQVLTASLSEADSPRE